MIVCVSNEVGIELELDGSWQRYSWFRSMRKWEWASGDCTGLEYALDYATLRLHSSEAFIVVLSAVTGWPIEDFDEKAVRQLIREANREWEFVT